MSTSTRTVVVGSSFAGYTAALELRRRLADHHEVVVLDPKPYFTFIPSLIWLPFGGRTPRDVTFALAPIYAKHGIRFVNEAASRIDTTAQVVHTADGTELHYDKLLLATGPRLAFEEIPGLGPEVGNTASVCNLDHAVDAGHRWQRFLENPGPVVVGTAQGGSCFGASYEFLLNTRYQLKKHGLLDRAPVTFITSEPFLGHFGLGGVGGSQEKVEHFFDKLGIRGLPNSAISEVRPGEIELASGEVLPQAFSMIVPPFTGVDAVRGDGPLSNARGFVPVDDEYRHPDLPNVFAAGVGVALAPPEPTPVPTGVPKTGYMSEHMGKIAAANIAADLTGTAHRAVPIDELGAICMLDAGDSGIVFRTDRVLSTKDAKAFTSAGPHGHWAKLAFEKYFMASRRRGLVRL